MLNFDASVLLSAVVVVVVLQGEFLAHPDVKGIMTGLFNDVEEEVRTEPPSPRFSSMKHWRAIRRRPDVTIRLNHSFVAKLNATCGHLSVRTTRDK